MRFTAQVQEEIEARRVRCLAQALPLIVKAITLMCTRYEGGGGVLGGY